MVAWLSGALPARERQQALAAIAAGETQLAIGTHALFQEEVEFARLGLAIVDEQHRFGVRAAPRAAAARASATPHQLMMSATPIPRTLSMSYYADLDVSMIDELPPGPHAGRRPSSWPSSGATRWSRADPRGLRARAARPTGCAR